MEEWDVKVAELVDEYRAVRARVKARVRSGRSRLIRFASRPIRPLLSVEGQQYCYTLSLCAILVLAHTLWVRPTLFPYLHAVLFAALYVARLFSYAPVGYLPFCFDFCYFCNLMVLATAFFPSLNAYLPVSAFVMANGPVLWAVVLWRNACVLQSLDKMTSLAIHTLPALTTLALRNAESMGAAEGALFAVGESWAWLPVRLLLAPVAFYLLWQCLYSAVFDVVLEGAFQRNPQLESSLRWFTRTDKSSAISQGALRLVRRWGYFTADEDYDPSTLKTKLVFSGFQLLYTVITLPLAYLALASPLAHNAVVAANLLVASHSAAGFYCSNAYIKQRLARVAERTARQIEKEKQEQAAAGAGAGAGECAIAAVAADATALGLKARNNTTTTTAAAVATPAKTTAAAAAATPLAVDSAVEALVSPPMSPSAGDAAIAGAGAGAGAGWSVPALMSSPVDDGVMPAYEEGDESEDEDGAHVEEVELEAAEGDEAEDPVTAAAATTAEAPTAAAAEQDDGRVAVSRLPPFVAEGARLGLRVAGVNYDK